jgi:hypothetical protein
MALGGKNNIGESATMVEASSVTIKDAELIEQSHSLSLVRNNDQTSAAEMPREGAQQSAAIRI